MGGLLFAVRFQNYVFGFAGLAIELWIGYGSDY